MEMKNIENRLRRIAWIAGAVIVGGLIISAVEYKGASYSRAVDINIEPLKSGDDLITIEDVRLAIDRSFGKNLVGEQLSGIDVNRVERVIESDPFVYNADVFIDAENMIHLNISQREPVVRVIDNNGLQYYLDRFGEKMPLSPHFAARVIVATGNIPPFVPDFLKRRQHPLKDIFQLTKEIVEDPFLYSLVEQIYKDENGEYTLIPKVGNHTIMLGTVADIKRKLKKLKVFYKEGLPYEGWQKYKSINLKFDDQVVCKKR